MSNTYSLSYFYGYFYEKTVGMADSWEDAYGLDAFDDNDAAVDSDGDGVSNFEEFINGTSPNGILFDIKDLELSYADEQNQFPSPADQYISDSVSVSLFATNNLPIENIQYEVKIDGKPRVKGHIDNVSGSPGACGFSIDNPKSYYSLLVSGFIGNKGHTSGDISAGVSVNLCAIDGEVVLREEDKPYDYSVRFCNQDNKCSEWFENEIILRVPVFESEQTVSKLGKLNDTGITWGANYPSGNNTDCSGTTINQQDCSHGRDATHNDDSDGHAGFSFTKLDANGSDLAASASTWSCVRDNVTGLIWEAKTDDSGIHDKDNTYRWGGVTALGSGTIGTYYNDWDTLVNGSNTEALCGYTGWRVPDIDELLSLVNYGRVGMDMDMEYFPNIASRVWSSSPFAGNTNGAWYVGSYDGNINYYTYRDLAFRVRLVRSGQ